MDLAASRDRVSQGQDQLRSLSALAVAVDEHNRLLATQRAKVAAHGLAIRNDLLGEGQEHSEDVIDGGGLRAGDID